MGDLDCRLGAAIRAAVQAALDDGMLGRAIIRRLQSELSRLYEAMPREVAQEKTA